MKFWDLGYDNGLLVRTLTINPAWEQARLLWENVASSLSSRSATLALLCAFVGVLAFDVAVVTGSVLLSLQKRC